ncbi:MAG: tRNA uridine-5-carboxymethylaminomethyl(34) synthesis GTPase MnmE [Caulobacteraceae bacterium]
MTDTIFAPATAAGRAAVAVVRISGPETRPILKALAGRLPGPRTAGLRRLRHEGVVLDEALVLWFPGPASYTGEDAAELHLHGGPAIVDAVINALSAHGLRIAEPGEFTRRAFEHGRLDLAQAEAVADLIDAETAAQSAQALAQLGGALTARYDAWRGALIEALAQLEAAIDFPDEELPEDVASGALGPLGALRAALAAAVTDADRGRRIREGYRVAIIGAPNAGKSTLLNALAGRDAAIVTPIAGTTRDIIEVPLVIGGYKILLADMAGLRDTVDVVEAEGVRRARAWAEDADLRLWVVDASRSDGEWRHAAGLALPDDLLVMNKADLPSGADAAADAPEKAAIALTSPAGAGPVRAWLEARLARDLSAAEFPAATRLRHGQHLQDALTHLDRAFEALQAHLDVELAAEDVRLAARALARVTGVIDAEQILDRVFSSFCIGK